MPINPDGWHPPWPVANLVNEHSLGQVAKEEGVVCRTFLHPAIRENNLKPWLSYSDIDAEGFVAETQRLCEEEDAVPSTQASTAYTGSWHDYTPSTGDIRTLSALSDWIYDKSQWKSGTFENYSKPDKGSHVPVYVGNAANVQPALDLKHAVRVMDFGCGSGTDVVAMQQYFNSSIEDTLCADIFEVKRPEVKAIVLNATTDEAYAASLDAALSDVEGSVHLAVSMVTFHHILPGMRGNAFKFITKALRPGGLFLMADWDNSVSPDLWIWYDINHVMWPVISHTFPSDAEPTYLYMATQYLSIEEWISEAEAFGLRYNGTRTAAMPDHGTYIPTEAASRPGNANRDFLAVWERP